MKGYLISLDYLNTEPGKKMLRVAKMASDIQFWKAKKDCRYFNGAAEFPEPLIPYPFLDLNGKAISLKKSYQLYGKFCMTDFILKAWMKAVTDAFMIRYVKQYGDMAAVYHSCQCNEDGTVSFIFYDQHTNERMELYASLSLDDALIITNDEGTDITTVADICGWTKEDVYFITYGKYPEKPAKTAKCMIFVKAEYVRDAQAYLLSDVSEDTDLMDECFESGWSDINGDMLVAILNTCNPDDIKSYLKNFSPKADLRIFKVIAFAEDIVL